MTVIKTKKATYGNYAKVVLRTPDLFGYWQFNEKTGLIARPTVKGVDAVIGSNVSIAQTGHNGRYCFTFPGSTNSSVSIPLGRYVGTAGQTIEFWFKTSTATAGTKIICDDRQSKATVPPGSFGAFTGPPIVGTGSNGGIHFGFNADTVYIAKNGTNSQADGNWHHAVGVWSGSSVAAAQITSYIDGSVQTTSSNTTGSLSNANALGFGPLHFPETTFIGSISDVALYQRALTGTEVTDHFNAG